MTIIPPIPYVSTDPAPTATLCRYVSMSVWMGWQSGTTSGGVVGAMAEHRPSLEPSMAASCGYQRRSVFELQVKS